MYFRSYGPLISDELALSPGEFGRLASAFFGSFALLQIPVGIAFDRWGVRRPMALMMLVGAAGSGLLAASSGVWSAFAGQVAVEMGCAPIFMGVLYYLGRLHSHEKAGRLAATVSSIGSVGALLSASPRLAPAAIAGKRSVQSWPPRVRIRTPFGSPHQLESPLRAFGWLRLEQCKAGMDAGRHRIKG
ncbi:hypothetical protein RLEG12_08815 (plasmid) [Rhizobium leguminosarum bv. trifolii CB782]|nr:hypothetical protein RLEG12_08815 [Rhizobium leguminosarum bv. trifolii CB782]